MINGGEFHEIQLKNIFLADKPIARYQRRGRAVWRSAQPIIG
jgi:hypothetical protein